MFVENRTRIKFSWLRFGVTYIQLLNSALSPAESSFLASADHLHNIIQLFYYSLIPREGVVSRISYNCFITHFYPEKGSCREIKLQIQAVHAGVIYISLHCCVCVRVGAARS